MESWLPCLGTNDQLSSFQAAAAVVTRATLQTTMSLSNVRGPTEHVMFADNPIVHIIPSVAGHPHVRSYFFLRKMEPMFLYRISRTAILNNPRFASLIRGSPMKTF